jgi:hypothetical protein
LSLELGEIRPRTEHISIPWGYSEIRPRTEHISILELGVIPKSGPRQNTSAFWNLGIIPKFILELGIIPKSGPGQNKALILELGIIPKSGPGQN